MLIHYKQSIDLIDSNIEDFLVLAINSIMGGDQ
jgi:hypothetical protein